jgi:hypothetical protein
MLAHTKHFDQEGGEISVGACLGVFSLLFGCAFASVRSIVHDLSVCTHLIAIQAR